MYDYKSWLSANGFQEDDFREEKMQSEVWRKAMITIEKAFREVIPNYDEIFSDVLVFKEEFKKQCYFDDDSTLDECARKFEESLNIDSKNSSIYKNKV